MCGGGRLGDGKLRRDAVVRLDLDEGQLACAALAEGGGGAVGGEHVGVAVTAEARDGRVRVVPGAGGKLGDPRAHRLIDGQADMLLSPGASYDYIADHRRRQRGGGWGPEKVTGVGGVFLRGGDAAALLAWYAERLGIDVDADYGGTQFDWSAGGSTTWAVFPADTGYFGRRDQPCMVNYRVDDLDAMLAQLRSSGVEVIDEIGETPFGRFGWAVDPEGNRFELWQPPAGR